MNLAVVGSRSGAHLDDVQEFILALHRKHPETVIISGGADGVDTVAEQGWLRLGGRVVSFRPKQTGPDRYVIERWQLATAGSRIDVLDVPTWANYGSAALYASLQIVEVADRVICFQKKSLPLEPTLAFARDRGIPTNEYTPEKRFA